MPKTPKISSISPSSKNRLHQKRVFKKQLERQNDDTIQPRIDPDTKSSLNSRQQMLLSRTESPDQPVITAANLSDEVKGLQWECLELQSNRQAINDGAVIMAKRKKIIKKLESLQADRNMDDPTDQRDLIVLTGMKEVFRAEDESVVSTTRACFPVLDWSLLLPELVGDFHNSSKTFPEFLKEDVPAKVGVKLAVNRLSASLGWASEKLLHKHGIPVPSSDAFPEPIDRTIEIASEGCSEAVHLSHKVRSILENIDVKRGFIETAEMESHEEDVRQEAVAMFGRTIRDMCHNFSEYIDTQNSFKETAMMELHDDEVTQKAVALFGRTIRDGCKFLFKKAQTGFQSSLDQDLRERELTRQCMAELGSDLCKWALGRKTELSESSSSSSFGLGAHALQTVNRPLFQSGINLNPKDSENSGASVRMKVDRNSEQAKKRRRIEKEEVQVECDRRHELIIPKKTKTFYWHYTPGEYIDLDKSLKDLKRHDDELNDMLRPSNRPENETELDRTRFRNKLGIILRCFQEAKKEASIICCRKNMDFPLGIRPKLSIDETLSQIEAGEKEFSYLLGNKDAFQLFLKISVDDLEYEKARLLAEQQSLDISLHNEDSFFTGLGKACTGFWEGTFGQKAGEEREQRAEICDKKILKIEARILKQEQAKEQEIQNPLAEQQAVKKDKLPSTKKHKIDTPDKDQNKRVKTDKDSSKNSGIKKEAAQHKAQPSEEQISEVENALFRNQAKKRIKRFRRQRTESRILDQDILSGSVTRNPFVGTRHMFDTGWDVT